MPPYMTLNRFSHSTMGSLFVFVSACLYVYMVLYTRAYSDSTQTHPATSISSRNSERASSTTATFGKTKVAKARSSRYTNGINVLSRSSPYATPVALAGHILEVKLRRGTWHANDILKKVAKAGDEQVSGSLKGRNHYNTGVDNHDDGVTPGSVDNYTEGMNGGDNLNTDWEHIKGMVGRREGLNDERKGLNSYREGVNNQRENTTHDKEGANHYRQRVNGEKEGLDKNRDGMNHARQGLNSYKEDGYRQKEGLYHYRKSFTTYSESLKNHRISVNYDRDGAVADNEGTYGAQLYPTRVNIGRIGKDQDNRREGSNYVKEGFVKESVDSYRDGTTHESGGKTEGGSSYTHRMHVRPMDDANDNSTNAHREGVNSHREGTTKGLGTDDVNTHGVGVSSKRQDVSLSQTQRPWTGVKIHKKFVSNIKPSVTRDNPARIAQVTNLTTPSPPLPPDGNSMSTNTTVAIGMGITLKGLYSRHPSLVGDTARFLGALPFFAQLLPSFCRTASKGYAYHFYLAHDVDDPFFNNPRMLAVWKGSFEMAIRARCGRVGPVGLHVVRCTHAGRPAWAQNDAMMAAYRDGCDFFYRVNDDSVMVTGAWTTAFIQALRDMKPPLVGIVGPNHSGGNTAILTYEFVHRTHVDIFGYYYPREFPWWYADEWITCVYRPSR